MDKIDAAQTEWRTYWQGRHAGRTGEVFAGEGVEKSEELSDFWADTFSQPQSGIVLDLACGAGSALRHAAGSGASALLGLDISRDALLSAGAKIPGFQGVVGSADALPFADGAISHVISQFGFEYSDRSHASAEVARVIGAEGAFTAIVHLKSGAIAAECEQHLANVETIKASQYIDAVEALYKSVFAFDRAPSEAARQQVDEAGNAFQTAQGHMAPVIKLSGFARQLHDGARQLFERRKAYLLEDLLQWLDQMRAEMEAYRGRMNGMLSAAIDEQEARQILSMIAAGGTYELDKFHLAGKPAAWMLSAQRKLKA
ncbi:MAG: class I SAM-dependent methyltransferase [Pseudomonadota bacterium]